MHILKAVDLKKRIKDLEIVKGMSLEVQSGEVVGLLGPNGAGKTTFALEYLPQVAGSMAQKERIVRLGCFVRLPGKS